MYLGQITGELTIGRYKVKGFHSAEIKHSIHQVIQTAKVVLPLSFVQKNNDKMVPVKLVDKIKEGDKVAVSFGYDNKNKTEFTGYVRDINWAVPVELFLEDELYIWRRTFYSGTFNLNLKGVLNDLADVVKERWGIEYKVYSEVPEIKVQNLVANNKSALWVLQQLIEWYPMLSIRLVDFGGEKYLYCNLKYKSPKTMKVNYAMNGSKCNTASVSELKYNIDRKTVKVIWSITKKDGTIIKKTFGDSAADIIINKKISTEISDDLLQKITDQEMTLKNYAGLRGSFTTFMEPFVEPGVIANMDDPQFHRNGNYYIGTVTTTVDTDNGIKRKLEIDFKLK